MSSSSSRKRSKRKQTDDADTDAEAPVKKSKRSSKKSGKDRDQDVDFEVEVKKSSKRKGKSKKEKSEGEEKRRAMKPEESAMPPFDPNKQYPAASTALSKKIDKAFRPLANATAAAGMAKYMRNQFTYFGLKSPVLRAALKPIVKEALAGEGKNKMDEKQLIKEMRVLWSMREGEFHYAALELASAAEKLWSTAMLHVFAEFGSFLRVLFRFSFECAAVENRGWWDSVDTIAGLVGRLLNKVRNNKPTTDFTQHNTDIHTAPITAADGCWLDRRPVHVEAARGHHSSARVQIKDRRAAAVLAHQGLVSVLCDCVRRVLVFHRVVCCDLQKTMHEDDFFIRKAIGWALREYSKAAKVLTVRCLFVCCCLLIVVL